MIPGCPGFAGVGLYLSIFSCIGRDPHITVFRAVPDQTRPPEPGARTLVPHIRSYVVYF